MCSLDVSRKFTYKNSHGFTYKRAWVVDKSNRHLKAKLGYWHYQRRVPKRYEAFDGRGVIACSLRTKSLEIARMRRDAMEESDDLYWAMLAGTAGVERSPENLAYQLAQAERRYQAAQTRALARGFVYAPIEQLASHAGLDEIVARIRRVDAADTGRPSPSEKVEADALLGTVSPPPVTVSAAFETYCSDIAASELIGKSEAQIRAWKKTKRRGVQYFIDVVGDRNMRDVTRQDAQQYYNWWKDRVVPKPGREALSTKTANRDVGNMRLLYSAYFKYIGEEDRVNPFRNLSFKDRQSTDVPPFEDKWVRERILAPGALSGLIGGADLILYTLIETGCRPGEIANLLEEDIHLKANVPYISIRPKKDREIKTVSSIRDIPLVGVALEAMRLAPKGFPHYRDKPDLLSANLMSALKSRGLFPSPAHKVYSLRHSFEKRMQEAELDYGFRCMIMGHANSRPAYGDGGSMEYRRDQLLKIAHPVPEAWESARHTKLEA